MYITFCISLQVSKRLKSGSDTQLSDFDKKLIAKCNELGYSMGEFKKSQSKEQEGCWKMF